MTFKDTKTRRLSIGWTERSRLGGFLLFGGSLCCWLSAQTAISSTGSTATSAISSNYVNPTSLPSPVRGYLLALGNRIQTPGNERTTLLGSSTDQKGTESAQLIWQVPGEIRFVRTNEPTVIYDPSAGLVNASSITPADADILESLFDDAAESFIYGFSQGSANRFFGSRFRTDTGTTPNYQGPWYDIYNRAATAKAQPGSPSRQKLYYFDSQTRLLAKTLYILPNSINVSTEFSNWIQSGGQAFPGRIVRTENGSTVFSFTVSQASAGTALNDGLFP